MVNSVIIILYGVMWVFNCDWDIDWCIQLVGEGVNGFEQIFFLFFLCWIGLF